MFSVLTTNQKGAVAETAIALEAIKLGIDVYRPYVDGRYDLIFEIGRELLRIQCKWAARQGDGEPSQFARLRIPEPERAIPAGGGDPPAVGLPAFCLETGRCYFLPADFTRYYEVRLRLDPAKNNQRVGSPLGEGLRIRRYNRTARGRSSAGRATGWQPVGQGFESPRLHHTSWFELRRPKAAGFVAL